VRCANCGGELPGPARFCPHCSAPQPGFDGDPVDEAVAAVPRTRGHWLATHVYTVLVFLAAAIVVFAVLAIALGWIGEDVLGL
jgi:hypothetical protein